MTKSIIAETCDILLWIILRPIKIGSFEDYIISLHKKAIEKNVKIKFVIYGPCDTVVKKKFIQSELDIYYLDKKEIIKSSTILQFIKKTKPKIIHFHFMSIAHPCMLWIRLLSPTRIYISEHTSTFPKTHNCFLNHFKFLRNWIMGLCVDYVFGVSDFISLKIKKNYGLSTNKVATLYNGIDSTRFTPLEDSASVKDQRQILLNVTSNKEIITYIGQLESYKGIDLLIEAARYILARRQDCIFIVVGAGSLKQKVIELEKKMGINKFRYLGVRNDTEKILQCSDIFVSPSQWEEAFGLTLAEASLCAIPIISTKIGGIPEVVLHEKSGFLVEKNDLNGLISAIGRMLDDKILRKKMGQEGRTHSLNHFTLERLVEKTISYYLDFLGK